MSQVVCAEMALLQPVKARLETERKSEGRSWRHRDSASWIRRHRRTLTSAVQKHQCTFKVTELSTLMFNISQGH
jgi:hypothetical protein